MNGSVVKTALLPSFCGHFYEGNDDLVALISSVSNPTTLTVDKL